MMKSCFLLYLFSLALIFIACESSNSTTEWQLNGSGGWTPVILDTSTNHIQLTSFKNYNSAGSAFSLTPLNLSNDFSIKFEFSIGFNPKYDTACDGFTVCLQNSPSGAGALGADAIGFGYGGISNSFALGFTVCSWRQYKTPGFQFITGGATFNYSGFKTMGEVVLKYEHLYQVSLSYQFSSNQLQFIISDNSNGDIYSETQNYNLANIINGLNNVFFGFTGATGGQSASFYVNNVQFWQRQI